MQSTEEHSTDARRATDWPERLTGALGIEEVFFLTDLTSLDIPWVGTMVDRCQGRDDVRRLWFTLRHWGPTEEDVEESLRLAFQNPLLADQAEKMRCFVSLLESWRPLTETQRGNVNAR